MEECKPKLCVMCFDVTSVENSRIVEETIKVVLDVLLLKLPVEASASVICNVCYSKAFEAYQFKTACIHTEDRIFPYVSSTNGIPVDLKPVYLKEKGKNQFRIVLEDEKICRLCMEVGTSGFTCVRDLERDLISKYIPEVNFDSTMDSIVCTVCVESLKRHSSFLRNCLGVKKFENISEDEPLDDQFCIKTEEIEIKSEQDNQDIYTIPANEDSVCETNSKHDLETQLFKATEYECNTCAYRSTKKHNLATHELKHKKLSEVHTYECGICNFITKHKGTLVAHQLMHRNDSVVRKYKCYACNFESKYKSNVVRHELLHRDTSEVQIYTCDSCNYETKFKNNVAKHQLIHKDIGEVQMHKCDICGYESKRKGNLNLHRRIHKDISQIQMYTCDACNYYTRYKSSLTRHSLTCRKTFGTVCK